MKVVQDAINSGDYQQLNEQVRKTVSASVQEVCNMGGKLQNGLKEGMRQMGNGVQEGFKEGMNTAQREWKEAWRESGNTGWRKTEVTYRTNYGKDHTPAYQTGAWKQTKQGKQLPSMYSPNPPGKITGTVLAITGYSLTGVFALSTIIMGIVTVIFPHVPEILGTSILGVITAASLGMGITGSVIRGRVKRFRQYVQQMQYQGTGR